MKLLQNCQNLANGRGTMSLGQFNFGGGQWVVTIMMRNNTKLSIVP
jgi:hypothetical protein